MAAHYMVHRVHLKNDWISSTILRYNIAAESNKAQFEAFREFGNLKPMEDLE